MLSPAIINDWPPVAEGRKRGGAELTTDSDLSAMQLNSAVNFTIDS